jgi:phage terminase large subunit-like protein
MNAAAFQRRLRAIADRYLAATRMAKAEIDALMAEAEASALAEPELFTALAQAEEARIQRMLDMQGIAGRGTAQWEGANE